MRTITPGDRYRSKKLSRGVLLESFHPGGIAGPNDEVLMPTPGGQSWSDLLILGDEHDPFQFMLPDIRMPANQYWPLHWHDCWTAVLVVEGQCCIGDWWMAPGDIFITMPALEYGPMVIGPKGVRLFEIFAQAHLAGGGYANEYHDHPTLRHSPGRVFMKRSALNMRNVGNQTLSCDGVEGIWKSRLAPGLRWNLGVQDDPDRGIMIDTRLGADERVAPHRYGDWHAILVLDGSIEIAGERLVRDDYLLVRRDAPVGEIVADAGGVHLLELARTARGSDRIFA